MLEKTTISRLFSNLEAVEQFAAGETIFKEGDFGDCTLVPLNEWRFLYMVGETPYICMEVMWVLTGRVRHMNRHL